MPRLQKGRLKPAAALTHTDAVKPAACMSQAGSRSEKNCKAVRSNSTSANGYRTEFLLSLITVGEIVNLNSNIQKYEIIFGIITKNKDH